MAKRRKTHPPRETPPPRPKAEKPAFGSPFKDLKKLLNDRPQPERTGQPSSQAFGQALGKASAKTPAAAAEANAAAAASTLAESESEPMLDDATMFRQAVDGVRRLGDQRPVRVVPRPEVTREVVSEDAEVLAQLSDLVSGAGTFELNETEEYTEGTRLGLDPRLVTRLRRGEFAVQAHIDLHGKIQADAKLALEGFVVDSVRKGLRTVLVVHGRGLRSPGGMPVLKHAAAQWLSHGHMGGYVLAFATARPADGGAGAMYVLLRRDRRRAKFDVLQGAKRRD
ncbi:MAG TPA: Smr/MutS family protein [Candidatus Binataceae bacterium]|jgi:DNA-nicking Smr family endonuclease|nr:Smr/MutS family protein [Candidatus Binataceae bacterium]